MLQRQEQQLQVLQQLLVSWWMMRSWVRMSRTNERRTMSCIQRFWSSVLRTWHSQFCCIWHPLLMCFRNLLLLIAAKLRALGDCFSECNKNLGSLLHRPEAKVSSEDCWHSVTTWRLATLGLYWQAAALIIVRVWQQCSHMLRITLTKPKLWCGTCSCSWMCVANRPLPLPMAVATCCLCQSARIFSQSCRMWTALLNLFFKARYYRTVWPQNISKTRGNKFCFWRSW